jgi:proline iminopeptidase
MLSVLSGLFLLLFKLIILYRIVPKIMTLRYNVSGLVLLFIFLISGGKGASQNINQKVQTLRIDSSIIMKDGVKLTYFIEGKGSPVIVVSDGELLANVISQELRKNFKFIFINGRMNVADPGDTSKITIDLLADDVEQVRKRLNLGKVILFGHSVSGLIAFEYARKYPQFTSRVIMNASPPFTGKILQTFSNTYWESIASKDRKNALAKNWRNVSGDSLDNAGTSEAGKLRYILDGPKCFYNYNFRADSLLKNSYWNMNVWNRIFSKLINGYDIGKGKTVNAPVFISLGRYDFMCPHMTWNDFKSIIPNLSFFLFENSGHYPLLEEEELFNKELLEWCRATSINSKSRRTNVQPLTSNSLRERSGLDMNIGVGFKNIPMVTSTTGEESTLSFGGGLGMGLTYGHVISRHLDVEGNIVWQFSELSPSLSDVEISFERWILTLTPSFVIPIRGGEVWRLRIGAGPDFYFGSRLVDETISPAGIPKEIWTYSNKIGYHVSAIFEFNLSRYCSMDFGLKGYNVTHKINDGSNNKPVVDDVKNPNGSGIDFVLGFLYNFSFQRGSRPQSAKEVYRNLRAGFKSH